MLKMIGSLGLVAGLLAAAGPLDAADTNPPAATPEWLARPLSLADALNLAEQHNAALLKSRQDLAAATGVAIQTRAIRLPKLKASGNYQAVDKNSIDRFPISSLTPPGVPPPSVTYADQTWGMSLQLVQSVYEGGRMASASRTARLLKEQAVQQYQATLADTLTAVRVAYCDILLAARLVEVQKASVNLLTKELEDTQRRFEAGTVPRFNVLRAEVELANARPRLIRAENALRIAKNDLANLLGFNLPKGLWEDIPLHLSDALAATPFSVDLPAAIEQALRQRAELEGLRKAEALRREGVVNAKAGRKPRAELFAGYGVRNSGFSDDLTDELHGWQAGAQVSWNIFDGQLTKGKVAEATALQEKARVELEDAGRRIELEVRTRYSEFVEARQVLESQKKVQEQAEEALRLANARAEAGTGTQLDVLNAQTSLTEARSTDAQALRDYDVALARLQRAIGEPFVTAKAGTTP